MQKREKSPLAGQEIKVKEGVRSLGGKTVLVVDWVYNACDKLTPAFMETFMNRIGDDIKIPLGDPDELRDVLLVLHGGTSAALVHIDELEVPENAHKNESPSFMDAVADFCRTHQDIDRDTHALIVFATDKKTSITTYIGRTDLLANCVAHAAAKGPQVASFISRGLAAGGLHFIFGKQ